MIFFPSDHAIQNPSKFYKAINFNLKNLNDEKNITNVVNELKVDSVNFYENIKKQETKELLTKLTQEAFDKKIFGAPTFLSLIHISEPTRPY